MNNKILHEGIMYVVIGMMFFLVTLDIIFPFIMFMMKVIFYIVSGLALIGGINTIIKSFKKNKNAEN